MATSINDKTITHIAGIRLDICGRIIQRCSLCGAKLCDNENTSSPLNPDGTQPEFPTWEIGRLIRVEINDSIRYLMLPDSDKLPDDSCIDFV